MEKPRDVGWVVSHPHVVDRNTSGERDPSPRPDHPVQDSSNRKISPDNFWLYKPRGVGAAEETAGF